MANQIKIRLKSGEHEIEIEATPAEVDRLLETWWSSPTVSSSGNKNTGSPRGRRSKTGRSRRSDAAPKGNTKASANFDPQEIVNAMREHEDYDTWEEKVLHQRAHGPKVKLVAWNADDFLTSGQIHSVLDGLGVKIDISAASRALKAEASSFQQQGVRKRGSVPLYKLTSKARKDFTNWLESDG